MKVAEKQNTAKQWSKALDKLNEAKAGQVAITYKDDLGKKRTS